MSDNPVRWHGVRPVSFEAQEMLCHAYVGMTNPIPNPPLEKIINIRKGHSIVVSLTKFQGEHWRGINNALRFVTFALSRQARDRMGIAANLRDRPCLIIACRMD